MDLLMMRYAENLAGVLSCYDRIVITGTLPGACYADGMTSFLHSRGIRIFDYPQFALPLRERIRAGAATLAAEHGAIESSTLPRPTFARTTWWARCWPCAAMRRGWCM
jgi:hypothetical protein